MRITFLTPDVYRLEEFAFRGFTQHRFVVFDVEATGPDPDADSVTQLGAVCLDHRQPLERSTFMTLVRPWQPIPPKIEALTGVTQARVAGAPGFAEAWSRFHAFCSGAVLVTQCGYEYDYPLLDRECDRAGLPKLGGERLDTKALFALLHPTRQEVFSTDFLCAYYGIDRTAFKRHDALGDANLIARIFLAEVAEMRSSGIDSVQTDGIAIKRFSLPPL